jgi:hypothetical protein
LGHNTHLPAAGGLANHPNTPANFSTSQKDATRAQPLSHPFPILSTIDDQEGPMSDTYQYAARPGSAGLSILSFVGLSALTVFLWQISPGSVLLLMIPALLVCLWQIAQMPTYGIKMTKTAWHVMGGHEDLVIPLSHIAYVRLTDAGLTRQVGIMLSDGTEVILPSEGLPDPLDMIREATERGIPVRDLTSKA